MMTQTFIRSGLVVAAIGVLVMPGCASRKVTTAVEDQAILAARPASVSTPAPATPGPSPTDTVQGALIQPADRAAAQPPRTTTPPAVTEERVEAASPPRPPVASPAPAAAPAASAERPSVTPEFVDAYFDFDQFKIRDDAQQALEKDAGILKANSDQHVLIEGHCDERGTMAYNLVLGERRAQAVQRYLQDLGVNAAQMQITSYGKERPFCRDHSETCWQSNRRAHVTLR